MSSVRQRTTYGRRGLTRVKLGTVIHNENERLRSANFGFIGTKLFLAVLSKDTKRFEKWVHASHVC